MKYFLLYIIGLIKKMDQKINVLSMALPLVHETVVHSCSSSIIPLKTHISSLDTSNELANNITYNKCNTNANIADSINSYEKKKSSSNKINEIKHFTPANKE